MKLSIEEVEQIADLARLSLTEEEKTMYAEQLSAVLDYVDLLSEVDTTNVEGTNQVTGLEDIVREDVVQGCSDEQRSQIVSQFPKRKGNLLQVQSVFDR